YGRRKAEPCPHGSPERAKGPQALEIPANQERESGIEVRFPKGGMDSGRRLHPLSPRRRAAHATPPGKMLGIPGRPRGELPASTRRAARLEWRIGTARHPPVVEDSMAVSGEGSVTRWIGDLRAGGDSAAQHLWERYFDRLVHLARNKLRTVPRRGAA